ncbi:hypothetical protein ACEQ8H_002587 [Pleosporales sp. CAS-2024a]
MAFVATPPALDKRYFPAPNSMEELIPIYRKGLIALCFFALLSLISITALLVYITNRLISWRQHYREYVGYNQYVILIYNLLLADLQQSIAFIISVHWIRINAILAPTAPCFLQGWFLNIGDVASGLFVLAIAIHTWLGVVKGYKIPYVWFVVSVLGIWLFALVLTSMGPILHQGHFFARAGAWCWIAKSYQDERLWLHYIWVFIVQFGTVAIYGHVSVHLRGRIQTIMNNDTSKLTRATKFMVLYPIAYLALTMPIAVGRMVAMAGHTPPNAFFLVAGALLTSCGWVDALLYTLTRRVLVNNELSTGHYAHTQNATLTNPARPGDEEAYGLSTITAKEHVNTTTRSVTIVGGSNRLSRIVDNRRGRPMARSKHQESFTEISPTRSGSQESIIKTMRHDGINIMTETNIQVESLQDDVEDGQPSRPDSETTLDRQ